MTESSDIESTNNIQVLVCEVDPIEEANWSLNTVNIDPQPFEITANNKHSMSLPASSFQGDDIQKFFDELEAPRAETEMHLTAEDAAALDKILEESLNALAHQEATATQSIQTEQLDEAVAEIGKECNTADKDGTDGLFAGVKIKHSDNIVVLNDSVYELSSENRPQANPMISGKQRRKRVVLTRDCSICHRRFLKFNDFKTHTKHHNAYVRFPEDCSHCNMFKDPGNTSSQADDGLPCIICALPMSYVLYKCPHCDAGFGRKTQHEAHLNYWHNISVRAVERGTRRNAPTNGI